MYKWFYTQLELEYIVNKMFPLKEVVQGEWQLNGATMCY